MWSDFRCRVNPNWQHALARGELDVLLGGPPCQGFSTYGQRDPDDIRNYLYNHYLRFFEAFRPKAFVMENVPGILSSEVKVVEDVVERTTALNYGITIATLDAAQLGVPQFRQRVFIIGAEGGHKIAKPSPTHYVQSNNGNGNGQKGRGS